MIRIISALYFLSLFIFSPAQSVIPKLSIESGGQASLGKHAPFLLSSNRFGVYGIDRNLGYLRLSVKKDTSRKFDYLYGLDGINRLDHSNHLFLQQAYAGIKLANVLIWAGTKEEVYGNQDRELSTGGVLWSGNARPMPRVFLGTTDYVNFPWTKGRVQFKVGMGHGWFGSKEQYVKDAFLHDKYLFGKIYLKENLSFHFGLHHAAMWGGTSPEVGKLDADIKDFVKVFFVQSADRSQGLPGETENKYGNHVASYQFGLDLTGNQFDYALYMQTFLEDKNGQVDYRFGRKNKPDGLWGVTVRNKDANAFVRAVLFEYLHSSQQSGDRNKSGDDNYFNNYIYKTGWQYENMTIGTPFITSPAYLHGTYNYMLNNRVVAFNLGMVLKFRNGVATIKNVFSSNYGTVSVPFDEVKYENYTFIGYHYLFERYKNLSLNIESGFDLGELIGNNIGIRCSLKKEF